MRVPFNMSMAGIISLIGIAGLLVLARTAQQPVPITTVDREVSGRVDMSLGPGHWAIDGHGEVARTSNVSAAGESALALRKSSGGHLSIERRFRDLDRAAVVFDFWPDDTNTRLEIVTRDDAGPSLLMSFDPDGRVRHKQGDTWIDIGTFNQDGKNTVHLAWDAWAGPTAYTLHVGNQVLLDGQIVDGPRHIRHFRITLLDAPEAMARVPTQGNQSTSSASTWLLARLSMASGLHFDFGRLQAGESVRVLGLDGHLVGESTAHDRPLAETTTPFQILPLDGHPVDLPVRFQLIRDGTAVGYPSSTVFDARPGDIYRVGIAWQTDRVSDGAHDYWPLAAAGTIALAILAYLSISPRLDIGSGSIAALVFTGLRVLATEVPASIGISVGPLEFFLLAGITTLPGIAVNRTRLLSRFRLIPDWISRASIPILLPTGVIAAIAITSILAVAGTPLPDGAAHAAYVGHRWLQHGEVPYGAQWAIGAPGLYVVHGILADLFGHGGGSLLAARLAIMAVALALAARLGYRLGGRTLAIVAATTFALVGSWSALGAAAVHAPMIATIPILAAFLALDSGRQHADRVTDLAAGALLASAISIDFQAVFAVPVAAIWLWPTPRRRIPWPRISRIGAGAGITLALTAMYFAGRGVALDAIDQLVVERVRLADLWLTTNALPVRPGWDFLLWVPSSVIPTYALAAASVAILLARRAWWPALLVATALATQHLAVKLVYRFDPADFYPLTWIVVLALTLVAHQQTTTARRAKPEVLFLSRCFLAVLITIHGGFIVSSQYRAATSGDDALHGAEATLARELTKTVRNDAHLFLWSDIAQIAWWRDAAISGGYSRPSSAITVPQRRDLWLHAINNDHPDAMIVRAGDEPAELRSTAQQLGYTRIASGQSTYNVYIRERVIRALDRVPGTCEGSGVTTVGGLAPHDVVRIVEQDIVWAAGAADTGTDTAAVALSQGLTDVRVELAHPRTLNTTWSSEVLDELCPGDILTVIRE